MQIHYTDDMTLIPTDIDLVVMTPAIPKSMNIYKHFIKLGTPVKKRSQVLGEITSVVKILQLQEPMVKQRQVLY